MRSHTKTQEEWDHPGSIGIGSEVKLTHHELRILARGLCSLIAPRLAIELESGLPVGRAKGQPSRLFSFSFNCLEVPWSDFGPFWEGQCHAEACVTG